jgi:hypothetical protein
MGGMLSKYELGPRVKTQDTSTRFVPRIKVQSSGHLRPIRTRKNTPVPGRPRPSRNGQVTFGPYKPGKTLRILNVLDEASQEQSPGYAEFRIGDETYELAALADGMR